ncbi:MAG TPA: YbaB/EbfC family nucleoid-associated protein [Gammaproteobacteria bacterium]|nr:YbaB/EbfC family nucleoid-associated protein [Gammaproteobacteria bacterium]
MPMDFGAMLREAQNLKSRLGEMQSELAQLECNGEAGGGQVRVRVNGNFEVRRVEIEAQALGDHAMLEDLVAAATNDALARVRKAIQERFAGLAGNLPLPPGLLPGA